MTTLLTLLVLAHFHLLGLAIILCIGAIIVYVGFALLYALFAIPMAALNWLGDKMRQQFLANKLALNPAWKRKADRWAIVFLVVFTSPLWGLIAFAMIFPLVHS